MTSENRFKIIFVKLAEALAEQGHPDKSSGGLRDASLKEIDEIDELRRLALEIREPEPMTYTTT